ncbi:hypothetical protein EEX84_13175 [Planococcus salinus]|uniref:Flagellin C-terminal domain-containing protein n=2 Tax=Planococcus salinus TaxID=1848460 RepID=A0A3M8P543_9BACL|nr:hypothetical protein EEX84_13175 [Planococcus salinus]
MPAGYTRGTSGAVAPGGFGNALALNVASNGELDLRTNEGYPATGNDDGKILIYGGGSTSTPSLLIGNAAHNLKENVSQNTVEENGVFRTVSTINDIHVTQTVKVVDDKYEFKYTIENNSAEDQEIGFYFHMDTMLGTDDYAPFVVNDHPVLNEEAFIGSNLPETFNVYNNNGNPDIKAGGVIKGAAIIEEPAELRIGQYGDVADAAGWIDDGSPVGDSGYALLWSNRTVAAGGSFKVNTFYGLDVPPTIANPSEGIIEEGPYDILLQVGANSGDQFKVRLSDVRTTKLEVDDIEIDPFARAMEALEKLDKAIQKVSSERSKYGAYHNALDHTYSNVESSAINLTSAESRIRDTDMAKEVMNHAKASLLSEASQAILAQANQVPQRVLELLK